METELPCSFFHIIPGAKRPFFFSAQQPRSKWGRSINRVSGQSDTPFKNLHRAVILQFFTLHHSGKLWGWNCFHSYHDEQDFSHVHSSCLSSHATTCNWKINKEFMAKRVEIKGGSQLVYRKSI